MTRLEPTPLILLASAAVACMANAPIARESEGTAGATSGSGGAAGDCDLHLAEEMVQAVGLTAAGPPTAYEETLPAEFTDAHWGLLSIVCQEGGYNLAPFAGTRVCWVAEDVTRLCEELPTTVAVLMREETVACVFLGFRPGIGSPPGVYSVTSPNCHD
jgi:hypothetical protein